MIGRTSTRAGALLVVALVATLPSAAGCGFAVKHPAITAGVVGGALALGTCKLASDDYGACFAVGGGAGAFLGVVAATALWLGGDGHSVLIEEQAKPLPEDGRPIKRRRHPAVDPDAPTRPVIGPGLAMPGSPTPTIPAPTSPGGVSPGPVSPGGVSPGPVSPGGVSPGPVSPGGVSPGPVSPGGVSPGPTSPGAVSPGPASPDAP